MIFKYDEFKEGVTEDFEQFYIWGFKEKEMIYAALEDYQHIEGFGQIDNICIHLFMALNRIRRQLCYDETLQELNILISHIDQEKLIIDLGGEYFKYHMDLHTVLKGKSGGYIWKNKNTCNIGKIVRNVEQAVKQSGNILEIDENFESFGKACMCTHASMTSAYTDASQAKNLNLIIYASSPLNDLDFRTWEAERCLQEGNHMTNVIYIEDVSDRGIMLLHFLYEYMKWNQEDIFFGGGYRWYFTYEDIARIIQKQRVDACWYCKNPCLKEVDYWDNHIEINGKRHDFACRIMQVEKYGEYYIIRHGSQTDTGICNIYCLDGNADIVWQLDNLYERYPDAGNPGIDTMRIEDGMLIARDFSWENKYFINIKTGEVEEQLYQKGYNYKVFAYPFR